MKPACLLFLAIALQAQQNVPHAAYVYPAGGRIGETFEVTVGGQFLDGVNTVMVSGTGVQATIIEYIKPITQGQATQMRDQMKELTDKKAAGTALTPAEEQKILDIRKKLATFVRRPLTPALAESVKIQIKLDPGAAPGDRALRLLTTGGLTNPLVFCLGDLPEVAKPTLQVAAEVKAKANQSAKTLKRMPPVVAATPTEISLPVIVNGQIAPGGVDRYRFTANKGLHLVVTASARELIPYISDAVPGWFQAAIALLDASGKEVGYADHHGFEQDPVLYYEIPEDGQYTLVVHDSIYRGREDFVYRIAAGALPYVTNIFPLGGPANGKPMSVELHGWNLPSTHLVQTAKGKTSGIYPVTANRRPFAFDTLPEVLDREPNDTRATAQRVKLPIIVNGKIGKPGDQDVFRFDGRAGDEIVAEVVARRLESPLDSILHLNDAKGKEIAVNDDFEDRGAALLTHQADSFLQVKLPATGTYYLTLGDNQHQGGPDYAYRLRISRPMPDYQLRVTPSSLNARASANVPIAVYALRRDGFDGPITLKLKDAPRGFTLTGATIPAHQNCIHLTLTAPPNKTQQPVDLRLEGRASIGGHEVTRIAVPAEDQMQAFYYHHLVTEPAWLVQVLGTGRARAQWKVPEQLTLNDRTQFQVTAALGRYATAAQLALVDPPEGITLARVSPTPTGLNVVIALDPAKVKPGLEGNLILEASVEANKKRNTIGMLPAIPFRINVKPLANPTE